MANLEQLVPNYRRAQLRWPSAPTLGQHYGALAACLAGNGHGLVEHVKSFIESVCVTIMGELGEPMPSSTPSTTDLLVAALRPLGLRNTKGASKLDKVLSGFNRLSDALTEMRNETGPVAHGKDGFLDSVTADHARAFLFVGDAILGVVMSALEGKEPDLSVTREPYENFPHHNERIDLAVGGEAGVDEDGDQPVLVIRVATGPQDEAIELRIEPSRLLFGVDREAYIEVLQNAALMVADAEEEEPTVEGEVPEVAEPEWIAAESGPRTVMSFAYEGFLEAFRPGVDAFLLAEKMAAVESNEAGEILVDSLLATTEQNVGLDWTERESIQARLKVACKRVLVHFGEEGERADEIAGRFVAWLRVQVGARGVSTMPAAAEGQDS